jgi:hypothetical protein
MTYIVATSTYDASRPFIVVHTKRSFNKVVGHYCTKEQAARRASDLNKRECFITYAWPVL